MMRPKCMWCNGDECSRPATWVVVFVDDFRARFSCERHRDEWNKKGRGTILARIEGFQDKGKS
jgi:hypothetical protein